MFDKKVRERCKYCSRFLTDEQKQEARDLCIDCASGVLAGIKKSFKIRAVFGVLCIVVVFVFIHYMRVNAFEYGEGVLRVIQVPTVFGYMTYRPAAFENIMGFSLAQQIMLGVIVFTLPFLRRIRFGMDSYQTFGKQEVTGGNVASHPMVFHGRGHGDRMGILISELFLSVISGPYYFMHGLVTMWKMSRYVGHRF